MSTRLRTGNLPVDVASFVGRDQEFAEVSRLLGRSRLVTLTGVGGVGKTRLALRHAGGARAMPDGVWLVELAAVSDPSLVEAAVAASLRVEDRTSREFDEVLVSYLSGRRLLLIMDNCEHLAGSVAFLLTRLLQAAPGLRVLATSREPLMVPGEIVYTVPPLPVPAALERIDLASPGRYAALALFAERAASVRPGFALSDHNIADVAAICRQLDGIPLALELAAARVRVLTPEQIRERLADRFRLLTRGNRAGIPRHHQTLQAAVDWSYLLCAKPERLLWQRASVFAGGFDLEAAQRVCAGSGLDQDEVLESVSGLADKSVLLTEERAGRIRYRLLDTIRQYGSDRLTDPDDVPEEFAVTQPALRRRHLDWYADLAGQFDADWTGPRQREWIEQITADAANIRAALAFALQESPHVRQGLRLATGLYYFWQIVGVREGRGWLEQLLAADTTPSLERARALSALALLLRDVGLCAQGVAAAREALNLLQELDDPALTTRTLGTLGFLLLQVGDPATAATLEEALARARDLDDPTETAYVTLSVGCCLALLGERERGEDLLSESIEICRSAGDTWWLGRVHVGAALVALMHGDLDAADAHALAALGASAIVHDHHSCATALHLLGLAETGRDPRRAAYLFGGTGQYWRDVGGSPFDAEAWQPLFQDRIAQARQALGHAAFDAGLAEGADATVEQLTAFALGQAPGLEDAGERADGSSVPGPTGLRLTPRELEVAALVAEGLSNRQVAHRLVLSERTVGGHVQRALTKLGFRSRTQLVTWLAQRGRPDDTRNGD